MIIHVLNKSTVLKDELVQSWLSSFEVYASHVSEWWSRSVSLTWCRRDREPPDAWKLVFGDTSAEAGDLGFHDFTPNGLPISYVFAADELQLGRTPTIAASHEIAEMIANPWISETFLITDTQLVAKEICDPCDGPEFAYSVKVKPSPAVEVSDFVLPKWFVPGSTGRFDRNGEIDRPLKVLPGGYLSVLTVGQGWTTLIAQTSGKLVEAGHDPRNRSEYDRLSKSGRWRPESAAVTWKESAAGTTRKGEVRR